MQLHRLFVGQLAHSRREDFETKQLEQLLQLSTPGVGCAFLDGYCDHCLDFLKGLHLSLFHLVKRCVLILENLKAHVATSIH